MRATKVLGINHVGLAPKDPEKARWFFQEVLGLVDQGSEVVEEQSTATHIFSSRSGEPTTLGLLEVLENSGEGDGPIKTFLEKKGSGLHHLAVEVDDLDVAIQDLKARGVIFINEKPSKGVCDTKIVFIHPKSTGGLLIELVESA